MAKDYRYVISQTKKLNSLMNKSIEEVLNKVGQDTVHRMKVFVNQYWYNKYPDSESYKRLGENGGFLGTITYEIKGNEVSIVCDWDLLQHIDPDNGEFGSHVGFDFQDFTTGLIQYIDTGHFYSGNSLAPDRKGSGFLEKTQKWLNKYMNDTAVKMIREKVGNDFSIAFGGSTIIQ